MVKVIPLPRRDSEPSVGLVCRRPACSRLVEEPARAARGRPKAYCSRACRDLAEKEYQLARADLRRAELVVRQFGRGDEASEEVDRTTREEESESGDMAHASDHLTEQLHALAARLSHEVEMTLLRRSRSNGPSAGELLTSLLDSQARTSKELREVILVIGDAR